jgi:AraC family transcriptional regulator of adaptative response / DNA-3-methyladenine glycosylase II
MAGLSRLSGYTNAMNANSTQLLERSLCSKARLARDARFDGLFFIGVKSTGIFCRPICSATPPKEVNVDYFPTALSAAQTGLRPCLRCRPEAAPGSPAWQGVQTTLTRAMTMIDSGEWREQSVSEFAERLGVSDRYLRKLFSQHLGISPLKYANFRRALFAKQLLQQTNLPVSEVAYMAGFGSTRRFNTVFLDLLGLNPGQLRRAPGKDISHGEGLSLFLSYRPPYDWAAVRAFYQTRHISGIDLVTENCYSRSFTYKSSEGFFIATHVPRKNGFRVELFLSEKGHTLSVIKRIRSLLDLDADTAAITSHLASHPALASLAKPGLRLPGLWSPFEAGIRAILGQQVSVKAAHNLVSRLVNELGKPLSINTDARNVNGGNVNNCGEMAEGPWLLFPEPEDVARSDLSFLNMPGKRREALRLLAQYLIPRQANEPPVSAAIEGPPRGQGWSGQDYHDWLAIPGIGPWTVQYTAFRTGHPDIFLAGDLGVKNALKKLGKNAGDPAVIEQDEISPWGSYATLMLWQSLAAA